MQRCVTSRVVNNYRQAVIHGFMSLTVLFPDGLVDKARVEEAEANADHLEILVSGSSAFSWVCIK